MEPIWIGSPRDVRANADALAALAMTNDSRYLEQAGGVHLVDHDRWLAAQDYERDTWLVHTLHATSDRAHEHLAGFDGYQTLPAHLGRVLEVGCGPFTQIVTILAQPPSSPPSLGTSSLGTPSPDGRSASHITLLDPLIRDWVRHPHCPYATWQVSCHHLGRSTIGAVLFNQAIEDLNVQSVGDVDLLVCVNVLEHVRDVQLCLDKLLAVQHRGSRLVFHERSWDKFDPHRLYDVGHPIRVRTGLLLDYLGNYEADYVNRQPTEHGASIYFIGRRK